jgi:predicted phage baseplate assembly protein
VSGEPTPALDGRDAEAIYAALAARLPAWVPGWTPGPSGPGASLLRVGARHLESLARAIDGAPDKGKLAFLDMLGVNLMPAQAARVPVVFSPIPNVGDGHAAAGTRVGATVRGRDDPLVFETDRAVAVAAARLTEVVSLWPARDACADHSVAATGGQRFTPFTGLQPVPHELYLAHDTLFELAGETTIELRFELATPGSVPLAMAWEHWDGALWRAFAPFDPAPAPGTDASVDGTIGLTRSGVIRLVAECAAGKKRLVNGFEHHWIRARLTDRLVADPARVLPVVDRIAAWVVQTVEDIDVDAAFADGLAIDVSKAFYPFGVQPSPGNAFYVASDAALARSGAIVSITATDAKTPAEVAGATKGAAPDLILEAFGRRGWTQLANFIDDDPQAPDADSPADFIDTGGLLAFEAQPWIGKTTVNGREGRWVRIRVASGGYDGTRTLNVDGQSLVVPTTLAPALDELAISWTYRSVEQPLHRCLAFNDFGWVDATGAAGWRGETFSPFWPVADRTPTLYLGFDRALPADALGLFIAVEEDPARPQGPRLVWEHEDDGQWTPLAVEDETAGLAQRGIVSILWPGGPPPTIAAVATAEGTTVELADARDAGRFREGQLLVLGAEPDGELVTVAAIAGSILTVAAPVSKARTRTTIAIPTLPRFGRPRTWIRVRLEDDGDPGPRAVGGISPNATWAVQAETVTGEVLGPSDGQPGQVFFLRATPILPGQVVEVRELEGARAEAELPRLQLELAGRAPGATPRTVVDRASGRVTEVWVTWQERPNLYFSGPDDRHYVLERSRGRIIFGDGRHGRIPPVGQGAIRAAAYRTGGGEIGNVRAGGVDQLLAGVLAQAVTNPIPGEGGADGEPVAATATRLIPVSERGPRTLRYRRQAIGRIDYEALAREASPAVAVARALPTTDNLGHPARGWVRVVIVPQSREPQPQPSRGLRRLVQRTISARVPATVADRVTVVGPDYLEVGVAAVLVPASPDDAKQVLESTRTAIQGFLHPLIGGPDGDGWPFGRNVYLSDCAAVLSRIPGLDHADALDLLIGGTPVGEVVAVPADRMVAAGPIDLRLAGRET